MPWFLAALSLVAAFAATPSVEAKEVRVYSGRHYNTDRKAYKNFSEQTGNITFQTNSTKNKLHKQMKQTHTDIICMLVQQI